MKCVVIYDSLYGNTEKIAKTVAGELNCEAISVDNFDKKYDGFELIVFGSPVHGGQASEKMKKLLFEGKSELVEKKVAVFDTRFEENKHGGGLKLLMKIIGYASPKMAKGLEKRKARIVGVEGFVVEGKEGPLKEGEILRAKKWGKSLVDG